MVGGLDSIWAWVPSWGHPMLPGPAMWLEAYQTDVPPFSVTGSTHCYTAPYIYISRDKFLEDAKLVRKEHPSSFTAAFNPQIA